MLRFIDKDIVVSTIILYKKGVFLQQQYTFHKPLRTEVISISLEITQFIPEHATDAVISGWFSRAIDVTVQNKLIAFVLPELLKGPFHIVVKDLPLKNTRRTVSIQRLGNRIQLGDWSFEIAEYTKHWNPKPHWDEIVLESAQIDLLLRSINNAFQSRSSGYDQISDDVEVLLGQRSINDFWHALHLGNITGIAGATRAIMGKGPGLTPAGDDYLAGILVSLWLLNHPETASICRLIAETAQQCTTEVSNAYFSAIAAGQVDERWHQLLAALNTGSQHLLEKTIRHILTFGATSGLDMLKGFNSGIEFQTSNKKSL